MRGARVLKSLSADVGRFVASRLGVHGVDLLHDLRRQCPEFRAEVIFDVGANVGDTTMVFSRAFPSAVIHAFEPSRKNVEHLIEQTGSRRNVRVHQVAASSHRGETTFVDDDRTGTMSRVAAGAEQGAYTVETTALDDFCQAEGIDRISYLKVDTEGHEPAVFEGARRMLSGGAVSVVEVECGMNPENTYHTPFELLKPMLESHGLRLFGLYEQTQEWPTDARNLRRVNAGFISQQLSRPA